MSKKELERLKNLTKDIRIGFFLFLTFGFMTIMAMQIKARLADGIVSANFFPCLVGLSGMAFSLLLIVPGLMERSALRRKQALEASTPETLAKAAEDNEEPIRWGMILLSIFLMFVYLALMSTLGFILSSALYLFVQIIILFDKKTLKGTILIALLSISVPILLFLPFRYIFGLRLPLGIFQYWG